MLPQDLIVDLVIRYGFQLLGALVIIAVGLVAARWLGALADRALQRRRLEPPLRALIGRAIKLVIFAFTLLVALDKFGFQIAPLVAGLGVAGLGVGIALQGVLGNIVAGLSIIFTKPFRVGEHVEVLKEHGDVVDINLFSTVLVHPDHSRVVIPNRKIVGEIHHNFGTMRQIPLQVTVPVATDLAAVLATLREVVGANGRVLADPAAFIAIDQVNEAGIRVFAGPWVRVADYASAEGELYQAIVEAFRARRIALGVPQREVRLTDGVGLGVAAR
ncbi:MAG: mechanosensitive ion channel family protein [Candidatus Rokubacteria bacterium]|nr:mechanosensitive ion channel family protein [Candidatus Rokubacteria bacterium]